MEAEAHSAFPYVRVEPDHLPTVLSDHARRVADTAYYLAMEAGLSWRERVATRQIALLHEVELLETWITSGPHHPNPTQAWIALDSLSGRADLIPGDLTPAVREGVRRFQRWNHPEFPPATRLERMAVTLHVVAVADTFDVLMMCQTGEPRERCREAIYELRRQARSRLDPEIVESLISLIHLIPMGPSPGGGRPLPPFGP